MRNNFIQQQTPRLQLQSYKDQRSNNFEQSIFILYKIHL
jgi:hypothetical protein